MNEVKVGLLALVAIVTVVIMSIKITSNQSGFGDYNTYRTIIEDASGIFPKTPIKIAGINAGRIKKIVLEGNVAIIHFQILKKIKVTKNSALRIKTVGFLGDKYIEVLIGRGNDLAEDGDLIMAQKSAGIDTIAKDASEILVDVKDIVQSVKNVFEDNQQQRSRFELMLSGLEQLIENTRQMTQTLNHLTQDNAPKIQSLISNLNNASQHIKQQIDPGREDSAMFELRQILHNVDDLTRDLKLIVEDVKAGKGTVGKFLTEDKIADDVSQTLAGVRRIVNRVDSIRAELSFHSGVSHLGEGMSQLEARIFPSPERFYLLGLSTRRLGMRRERDIEITRPNEIESFREKTIFRNSLVYNIQMGRVFHDVSIRGGLIETTGGLGLDYHIRPLGLVTGFELFNFREKVGVNLRWNVNFHVWNVIYARFQWDDLLLPKTRSAFLSLGLRFNDEELRNLIGLFL